MSLIASPEEFLGRPLIWWSSSASAGSNCEPDPVASESGPGHAGCVRATVVRGDDLDVFVADVAVLILVFDPGVGEVDAAVEEREVVLACPRLNFSRRAVRPAVAVGPSPVPLLQELLVVTLQLVVEDDAPDVSAARMEALLRALVSAVNLRVVSQLARLPQAGVERLPGLVVALQAIRLEHVSTTTRQDDDVTVAALEWDSFEKARLLEMSKALPCWLKLPVTVEHVPQVIRVDDPKRSDRGERLALSPVQLIRPLPVSHEFAVRATRQVDMATEGTPADIVAVAADSRSTMALV
jgi:hypothetical protein